MLTPKGKLYGDITIACLSDNEFMVFGSGAAQEMHRRWFESHLGTFDVRYSNESSRWHGFAISGPNSRELLSRVCRDDVSAEAFKFLDIRRTFVAGVPAIVNRLSFSGELGYEIYVEPEYQLKLYKTLLDKADDLGLQHYGARALLSLRLEKGWGVWTLDFRPDFTAAESGLALFINWKKDFIGKNAALSERKNGPSKYLVSMRVETNDIDVSNDEAILKGDQCIGYVTSGGFAHHLGYSMAMGYVPVEFSAPNTEVEIEINGERYRAVILSGAAYDPTGVNMRA